MKTLIILIIVMVFIGVTSSQGLNDVCSPTIFNVYAVGKSGVFLKSTNAGTSYSSVVIGDVDLNSVYSTGQKIWTAGNSGKLFRSTDQGASWTESSVISGIDLSGVCFPDSGIGYVCGKGGRLFRSSDGGISWTSIITGVSFDLKGVKFLGANTGYVYGESSTLLKTTDGGLSWFQISLPFVGKIRSLDLSGNEVIAGSSTGLLLRSTDNGQNWTAVKLNIESLPAIVSLKIISPQNYLLALESSAIWKTSNGGANFIVRRNDYRDEISSVAVFDSRMYAAGKNYNVIARSVDAGESFMLTASTSYSVSFVQLLNDNLMSLNKTLCMNYQARGVLYSLHKNRLYRTLNMGQNWSVLSEIPVDTAIKRSTQLVVNMKDSSRMIAVVNSISQASGAYKCHFFRTVDYGISWQKVYQTDIDPIGNMICQDPQHPDTLYMGIKDSVFRSTNFGLNWVKIAIADFDDWCDIAVSYNNSQLIYASTNHDPARLLKSTNSGYNWFTADMISDTNYSEMPCIALNNLAPNVVLHAQLSGLSNQNGLKRSYTSGNTWLFIQFTGSSWAIDIARDDPNYYAYGSVSYEPIFLSTNTGGNFAGTTNKYAEQLLYYDRANLFINEYGTISRLKITYIMTPIGIESLSAKVPAEYLISQNYPNPFNPATNIKFEIPNAGPIRLSVFDALGREVAKLVDQNMDAGSYKADWNASGYPSGVYFYRLQSSGISITKKMVLAK